MSHHKVNGAPNFLVLHFIAFHTLPKDTDSSYFLVLFGKLLCS